MKIVNRTAFLALPAGTLFAQYRPHIIGDIQIKQESMTNDFLVQDLTEVACDSGDSLAVIDLIDTSLKTGGSFSLDLDCTYRDGAFNLDQLFIVWEQSDYDQLIAKLQSLAPYKTQNAQGKAYTGDGTVPDPALNVRNVERLESGNKWVRVSMIDLISGDVFRMFEPNGTRIVDPSDKACEWKVVGAPFVTGGVVGVKTEVYGRTEEINW